MSKITKAALFGGTGFILTKIIYPTITTNGIVLFTIILIAELVITFLIEKKKKETYV